ncbi:MAG TPA: hypothetical protein VGR16_10185 [Thermomicrobiales bacterium]|nr:hypothetical protein [Thermomicrobiales bacterium]
MNSRHTQPIDPALILDRLREGLLGVGFFSIHAGVFLLTALSLFLWDLITSPATLGVPAPRLVIPWGVLVLIHASIVAVFSVAREALAPDEPALEPSASRPAPAPPAQQHAPDSRSASTPPRATSRFRPAASTSLADAREASQETAPGAWRRPVHSLRQVTETFRRDGSLPRPHPDPSHPEWRPAPTASLSEEERRALGSKQLARWRGENKPPSHDSRPPAAPDRPAPAPPRQGVGTPVVRPIAPSASNVEEAEWTWLGAAATSHLARRDPEKRQGEENPPPPTNGNETPPPS